jgi:hypothetical protein
MKNGLLLLGAALALAVVGCNREQNTQTYGSATNSINEPAGAARSPATNALTSDTNSSSLSTTNSSSSQSSQSKTPDSAGAQNSRPQNPDATK